MTVGRFMLQNMPKPRPQMMFFRGNLKFTIVTYRENKNRNFPHMVEQNLVIFGLCGSSTTYVGYL